MDATKLELITQYNSDFMQRNAANTNKNLPYTFMNVLPFDINLFYMAQDNREQKLATIQPNHIVGFSHDMFKRQIQPNSIVYIEDIKNRVLTKPFTLKSFNKFMFLGSTIYGANKYSGYYGGFASESSVTGLYIHNDFPFGVSIHYRGELQGYVNGRKNGDKNEPQGYSQNMTYLNNNIDGYRLGEKLTVKSRENGVILSEIYIQDTKAKDVYLGQISLE